MRNKLKISLFGLLLLLPAASVGDNMSQNAYAAMIRVFALVLPEVSRETCQLQSAVIKATLEKSLDSSGLLNLSIDNLCDGDICNGKTVEEGGLDRTVKSIRTQQLDMYRRQSPAEKEQSCKKFISLFEKIHSGNADTPEVIFDRFVTVMTNEN